MAGDEVLAVACEFRCLAVVLAYEVAYPHLCDSAHAGSAFGSEVPFELLGCRVDGLM
jgi:hypothetical protein